jgi:hypothetical protein
MDISTRDAGRRHSPARLAGRKRLDHRIGHGEQTGLARPIGQWPRLSTDVTQTAADVSGCPEVVLTDTSAPEETVS